MSHLSAGWTIEQQRECDRRYANSHKEKHKKWEADHPERLREIGRNSKRKLHASGFFKNHPEIRRARRMVDYAVKNGRLIKPMFCSNCGGNTSRIEAHHPDYTKPLEVTWLCSPCHHNLPAQTIEEG